ncbi:hypothetical protein GFS31_40390 (plasmid) [Leptolyngbya sp. BL0902]|nr:hypothetical protein GFS31_40390 [Leptolyngbya sp. BL0902]
MTELKTLIPRSQNWNLHKNLITPPIEVRSVPSQRQNQGSMA